MQRYVIYSFASNSAVTGSAIYAKIHIITVGFFNYFLSISFYYFFSVPYFCQNCPSLNTSNYRLSRGALRHWLVLSYVGYTCKNEVWWSGGLCPSQVWILAQCGLRGGRSALYFAIQFSVHLKPLTLIISLVTLGFDFGDDGLPFDILTCRQI